MWETYFNCIQLNDMTNTFTCGYLLYLLTSLPIFFVVVMSMQMIMYASNTPAVALFCVPKATGTMYYISEFKWSFDCVLMACTSKSISTEAWWSGVGGCICISCVCALFYFPLSGSSRERCGMGMLWHRDRFRPTEQLFFTPPFLLHFSKIAVIYYLHTLSPDGLFYSEAVVFK